MERQDVLEIQEEATKEVYEKFFQSEKSFNKLIQLESPNIIQLERLPYSSYDHISMDFYNIETPQELINRSLEFIQKGNELEEQGKIFKQYVDYYDDSDDEVSGFYYRVAHHPSIEQSIHIIENEIRSLTSKKIKELFKDNTGKSASIYNIPNIIIEAFINEEIEPEDFTLLLGDTSFLRRVGQATTIEEVPVYVKQYKEEVAEETSQEAIRETANRLREEMVSPHIQTLRRF